MCPGCERLKVPHLISSPLCERCWIKARNGYGHCQRCFRYKLIKVKAAKLCGFCYSEQTAANCLRSYVARFTSRFPFNRELFNRLVAGIEWSEIREKHNRRLRLFGKFLQRQEITSPLSWEQIEALMPPLPRTNRYTPKAIRIYLLASGHLAAERGELEPYDEYAARRAARAPIARAPKTIQPALASFADWLDSRQMKPSAVGHHLQALARYWQWCSPRISRAQEVSPPLVTAYLLSLYWYWQCDHCGARSDCASENEQRPERCQACGHGRSQRRVPRCAQNTVRRHRASLFIFFEWAKLTRRVLINPVECKIATPQPTIRHYAPERLFELARFIAAPDSDATQALLLYFIVFHLATVKEVRYLRLPTVITLATKEPAATLSSTQALTLPPRRPSLGIVHPGRPGACIPFHRAAQPWLRPLLARFEGQRAALIGPHGKTRYAFVTARGAVRDVPVGPVWVWNQVKQSTRAAIGEACDPSTLRKTAAIYFTDRVGPGVLSRMGWEAQQAFAYTWVTRELISALSSPE